MIDVFVIKLAVSEDLKLNETFKITPGEGYVPFSLVTGPSISLLTVPRMHTFELTQS